MTMPPWHRRVERETAVRAFILRAAAATRATRARFRTTLPQPRVPPRLLCLELLEVLIMTVPTGARNRAAFGRAAVATRAMRARSRTMGRWAAVAVVVVVAVPIIISMPTRTSCPPAAVALQARRHAFVGRAGPATRATRVGSLTMVPAAAAVALMPRRRLRPRLRYPKSLRSSRSSRTNSLVPR